MIKIPLFEETLKMIRELREECKKLTESLNPYPGFSPNTILYDLLSQHGLVVYQFWTKELVDGLAAYIGEKRTLEVGAGDGMLAVTLKERGVNIVAVDNGMYQLIIPKIVTEVIQIQKMSYRKALEKYAPEVVLCSWMPYGEDWTGDFRSCESVEEYILIGDKITGDAGGSCGRESIWDFHPGFETVELSELTEFSLSRLEVFGEGRSVVVSFKRG